MNRETEAFKKENLKILVILLVLFLVTLGFYLAFSSFNLVKEKVQNNTVVRVIDGDTFEIASGEKIRLLCVDTPEINEKGYEEARIYLSNLILNKEVVLEKDVSERDSYGRLLRYVYVNISNENTCPVQVNNDPNVLSAQVCFSVGSDEVFVNQLIINQGYGSLFVYGDDKCEKIKGLL